MRIKKLLICSLLLAACSTSSTSSESFISDGRKVNLSYVENVPESKKEEVMSNVRNFLYAATTFTQVVFYDNNSEKYSKISVNEGSAEIFFSFENSYYEVKSFYKQKDIIDQKVENSSTTSIHFLIKKINEEYKVEIDEYTYNGETIYGKYLENADEAIKRMYNEYKDLPFSWNFLTNFMGTNIENDEVSVAFKDALVYLGDLDNGSYKIGLGKLLTLRLNTDALENFNTFIYSYSDFLLRSANTNLDVFSHGTTTTTKASLNVSYNI